MSNSNYTFDTPFTNNTDDYNGLGDKNDEFSDYNGGSEYAGKGGNYMLDSYGTDGICDTFDAEGPRKSKRRGGLSEYQMFMKKTNALRGGKIKKGSVNRAWADYKRKHGIVNKSVGRKSVSRRRSVSRKKSVRR